MNRTRLMSFMIVFVVVFTVSFNAGAAFDKNIQTGKSGLNMPFRQIPANQMNFLIITTEQFQQSKTRLTGVWIVNFDPQTDRVLFLPIFPQVSGNAAQFNALLANSFHLTKEGEPSDSFWQALKSRGDWWNGYFLVDERFQKILGNVITPFSLPPKKMDAIAMPTFNGWDDPIKIQEAQKNYYEAICSGLTDKWNASEAFLQALWHYDHFQTNLTYAEVKMIWEMLASTSRAVHCEFPTFPILLP